MTDMLNLRRRIYALGACEGATDFILDHKTAQEAWDACENGENMLWLLGRLSGEPGSDKRRKLVLAACDCAGLARKYTRGNLRKAFDRCQRTARAWARGKDGVTLGDMRRDADAASAAATSYASASYASAADAASSAADAAYANAAAAASYAAADAAANARKIILGQCAKIVRNHYPKPPRIPTKKGRE